MAYFIQFLIILIGGLLNIIIPNSFKYLWGFLVGNVSLLMYILLRDNDRGK